MCTIIFVICGGHLEIKCLSSCLSLLPPIGLLQDGIITVVDAKHFLQHLREEKPEGVENETSEQAAFADRVLLNKIDLVSEEQLKEIEPSYKKIKKINIYLYIYTCIYIYIYIYSININNYFQYICIYILYIYDRSAIEGGRTRGGQNPPPLTLDHISKVARGL